MKNPIMMYYVYDERVHKEENEEFPDVEKLFELKLQRAEAKAESLKLIKDERNIKS